MLHPQPMATLDARNSTFFFAALLASWIAAPAAADPIDDAVAARLKGDNATALRLLRPLADKGDAVAQSNLAFMYATGQGVPKDLGESAKWYRLAAEQGRAAAQFNLARMYATGQGVAKDEIEAAKWLRAAADQGHAASQFDLGLIYSQGRGVKKDDAEAAKWWRAAADQDDVPAQFNLGVAYQYGNGVPRNVVDAAAWYRRAADKRSHPRPSQSRDDARHGPRRACRIMSMPTCGFKFRPRKATRSLRKPVTP